MNYLRHSRHAPLVVELLESRLQPGETFLLNWFGSLGLDPFLLGPGTRALAPTSEQRDDTQRISILPREVDVAEAIDLLPAAAPRMEEKISTDQADVLLLDLVSSDVTPPTLNGPLAELTGCVTPGVLHGVQVGATQVTDMSGDGCTVVGAAGNTVFRWREATGLENLGGYGGLVGISYDGSTIVGDIRNEDLIVTGGRWREETGWEDLGDFEGVTPCDRNLSHANAVSPDGSIIVGLGWVNNCRAHGFLWVEGEGMYDLGAQNRSSRAYNVSAEGVIAVGWDEHATGFRRPTLWVYGEVWVQSENPGEIYNVTPDGVFLTGVEENVAVRWVWGGEGWIPEDLGRLPGAARAVGLAVSDDGNVIVGNSGTLNNIDAFYWSPDTGLVMMTTHLRNLGVEGLDGWRLMNATAVSADGTTIAGWGISPANRLEGWIVRLPT